MGLHFKDTIGFQLYMLSMTFGIGPLMIFAGHLLIQGLLYMGAMLFTDIVCTWIILSK
ncbi:MAG: hypothetical protein ABI406_18675 [Ktedonobacteraceae bacterium]